MWGKLSNIPCNTWLLTHPGQVLMIDGYDPLGCYPHVYLQVMFPSDPDATGGEGRFYLSPIDIGCRKCPFYMSESDRLDCNVEYLPNSR